MLSMYAPQILAKEIQFFLEKQTQNGSDYKQSMSKCNTVAFTEIAVIDIATLDVLGEFCILMLWILTMANVH